MKDGRYIAWLFTVGIVLTYIISQCWLIYDDNNRLKKIALEQKEIIDEQAEEIKLQSELLDKMFLYIDISGPQIRKPHLYPTPKFGDEDFPLIH
tara:strand:+ start:439 stop:720 length:282 start_codon:yes stop_codon:yes gene_type:complete